LLEIAKRNGDFRKNWGPIVGALLYLSSIAATRSESLWWKGLILAATGIIVLLQKYGWSIISSGDRS